MNNTRTERELKIQQLLLERREEFYTLEQINKAVDQWALHTLEELLEEIEFHILEGDPNFAINREYFMQALGSPKGTAMILDSPERAVEIHRELENLFG